MTREEHIYEASKAYSEYKYNQTDYENGFINGAKWADETMIENACKWLIEQKEMIGISFQEDFIERFKMAMNIKLKDASDFDKRCRMQKYDFLEYVESGWITEWDGFGYYGTKDKVSNIDCFESAPENMDYVYWYNK